MGTIFYFIKEAFRGFFQAKMMTFVSITTIAITLFFLSAIFIGIININTKLNETKGTATVNVFIEESISENKDALNRMKQKIDNISEVVSYQYIDKKSAMEKFISLYGAEMVEAVDENPLPASFELTLDSKLDIEKLKSELELLNGIDGIQYSKEWIDSLKKFQVVFYTSVSAIVFILLAALYLIISNTIKLTIYARKDLIRNMHYVGATDLFIKTPFILEGMLQGVIGGVISVIAIFVIKMMLPNILDFRGENLFFPAVLVIGAGFGWLGSFSAIRKFLV